MSKIYGKGSNKSSELGGETNIRDNYSESLPELSESLESDEWSLSSR